MSTTKATFENEQGHKAVFTITIDESDECEVQVEFDPPTNAHNDEWYIKFANVFFKSIR